MRRSFGVAVMNPPQGVELMVEPEAFTDIYVCPRCHGPLEAWIDSLACPACRRFYPYVDGIPDFLLSELVPDSGPILRRIGGMDVLARVYESRWWYPFVIAVYAGPGSTELSELVQVVKEMVGRQDGLLLDVACGPGTLGRRIVSPGQAMYGIDFSLGMLRGGLAKAHEEGRTNVNFSRASVEAMPFPDESFDAAICGGSLHLFPDTLAALREIARVMKPGAPLAVTTFIAGSRGLFRFRRARELARVRRNIRAFELPELQSYLDQAGFEGFEVQEFGSFAAFRTVRR